MKNFKMYTDVWETLGYWSSSIYEDALATPFKKKLMKLTKHACRTEKKMLDRHEDLKVMSEAACDPILRKKIKIEWIR